MDNNTMNKSDSLGALLKKKRQTLQLSQPELAERMVIEQSFLSKLENDHSLPSTDTFRRWIASLEVTLDEVMNSLPDSYISAKLRQIADIDAYITNQQNQSFTKRNRLLRGSALALSLSLPLFYIGLTSAIFPSVQYEYVSEGQILPDEPAMFYSNWHRSLPDSSSETRQKMQREVYERYDERRVLTFENRGESYFTVDEDDPEMRRTWHRRPVGEDSVVTRPINGLLQGAGLGLFIAGLLGFWRERRLYRK